MTRKIRSWSDAHARLDELVRLDDLTRKDLDSWSRIKGVYFNPDDLHTLARPAAVARARRGLNTIEKVGYRPPDEISSNGNYGVTLEWDSLDDECDSFYWVIVEFEEHCVRVDGSVDESWRLQVLKQLYFD